MHHTLLPPTERTALHREYLTRVSIVALFLVSVAFLIGIGSLFPAFIAASTEARTGMEAVAAMEKGREARGATGVEDQLKSAAVLSAALSSSSGVQLSHAIQALSGSRGQVRIYSLSIKRAAAGAVAVSVEGRAPTRESLLAFRTSIEALVPGSTVNLPLSSFAASKDIPFALQVTGILP